MKTQLLEDMDDSRPGSGFVPADVPPARPPRRPAAARQDTPRPDPIPSTAARTEPRLCEEETAAFSSERVDWPGLPHAAEPGWWERWGRRAAAWASGVAAAGMLAAGGLWAYQESRIDSTMMVLASHSLPARDAGKVGVPAAPPAAAPPAASAPSTVVLPAVDPAPVAPEPVAAEVPAPPVQEQALPLATAKPHVHKPRRAPVRAQPKAPVARAEAKRAPAQSMAETLRQCRAAGYHTAKCLARSCTATRFGLACKG